MNNAVTIVMIEDDEGHARLIEKNIRRAGVMNDVKHLKDVTSALAYFDRVKRRQETNVGPLLILLDLNLPDVSGTEVLKYLRGNSDLRAAPVIVLTTTDDEAEIKRCYSLGCNVYITKPVDYDQFANAIRQLGLFFAVIKVPDPADA